MKSTCAKFVVLAVISVAFALPSRANAADPADKPLGEKVVVAKAFRSSKLTGLNVRNNSGEKIGTVDELVVNVETGKIAYVAMSVGGVLGIGDKLFAVPYQALKFDHGKDEMSFILDMTKDRLDAAPGFDKSHWPDFADPAWADEVDKYYLQAQAKTPLDVKKGVGK